MKKTSVWAGSNWQPGAIKGNSLQPWDADLRGGTGGGLWSRPAASRCFSAVVTSCEGAGGGALSWSWLGHPESPNSWRRCVALNNCPSSVPSSVNTNSAKAFWGCEYIHCYQSSLPDFKYSDQTTSRSLWPQRKLKLENKCKCFAHCHLRAWISIWRMPAGS